MCFSIVVPVYNVKQYLEKCIESIEKQDFNDHEIILVDDGSTDGSDIICNLLKTKYTNIKIVTQKNMGLSVARNVGIEKATGDYVIFVDSDDFLANKSLENLKTVIMKSNYPDVIVNRRMSVYNNGHSEECKYRFSKNGLIEESVTKFYSKLQQFPDCWLGAWIFCVKREYLLKKSLFFYPGIYHEDEEWVPRVIFQTNSIATNNNLLYCNRVDRVGGITATLNIKRLFDKLIVVDRLMMEFFQGKYTEEVRRVIRERICALCFGVCYDLPLYKSDDNIRSLYVKVKPYLQNLNYSHKIIHKFTFYIFKIFGIQFVMGLMCLIRKLKM